MWHLYDFKTVRISKADNTRYLSSVGRNEYDCEEETLRQLDVYWYSGNMKNGDIVWSAKNIKNEAVSIPPDSIEVGILNIACGKK